MESQLLKIIRENIGPIEEPKGFTEATCPSAEMITDFDTWAYYCNSKAYCIHKIGFNNRFYCRKEIT